SREGVAAVEVLLGEAPVEVEAHAPGSAGLARILGEPHLDSRAEAVGASLEGHIGLQGKDVRGLLGEAVTAEVDELRGLDARKHVDRELVREAPRDRKSVV